MAGVVTAEAAEVTTVAGVGRWLIVAEAKELATVDNGWLESVLVSGLFLGCFRCRNDGTVSNTEIDETVTNAFGDTHRIRGTEQSRAR